VHYSESRRIRARFADLTDSQMTKIKGWWNSAGRYSKPWWWLSFPDTYAIVPYDDEYQPIYLITSAGTLDFPLDRNTRDGSIDGEEML
jgi:hypothetical protein